MILKIAEKIQYSTRILKCRRGYSPATWVGPRRGHSKALAGSRGAYGGEAKGYTGDRSHLYTLGLRRVESFFSDFWKVFDFSFFLVFSMK